MNIFSLFSFLSSSALALACIAARRLASLALLYLLHASLSTPDTSSSSSCSNCRSALIAEARYNVLFVMVEDMRPEHNRAHVIAPNIQRIASKGVSFDLALAQVSVCAPSRASLLTGLRPDTLGIYDFSHFGGLRHFRTFPSHFHRRGYQTSNAGKIFHWESSWHYSGGYWGSPEWEAVHDAERKFINSSVTPDAVNDINIDFGVGTGGYIKNNNSSSSSHINSNSNNDNKKFFRDSYISSSAIEFLQTMDKRPEPWMLTIGFKGTHMPYHVPKRFWDLYSSLESDPSYRESFSAASFKFPSTVPLIHWISKTEETKIQLMNAEGRKKSDKKEFYQTGKEMSARGRGEIYRGYLAALTYFDFELGKVLDVMDAQDLWRNTVVVFTSDHGMHLGEKGIWGKWTLFDESSRVPLIIHAPQYPRSFGKHFSGPVELVDVFPTLVDLTETRLESEEECQLINIDKSSNKAATKRAIPGEGPIRNSDGHVLRHAFCDALDGVSLEPVIRSLHELELVSARVSSSTTSSPRNNINHDKNVLTTVSDNINMHILHKPFAVTQRMTCKLPGTADLDPKKQNWIDFCPFKKLPRDPANGAIGYALRTVSWRYIAWLAWDTNTFLPSLNQSPLAEELYDHRGDELSSGTFATFSPELSEISNIASSKDRDIEQILVNLRKTLYDHLWFNASFEHLFQKRLSRGDKPNMKPIYTGRYHESPHPHRTLYKHHLYHQ